MAQYAIKFRGGSTIVVHLYTPFPRAYIHCSRNNNDNDNKIRVVQPNAIVRCAFLYACRHQCNHAMLKLRCVPVCAILPLIVRARVFVDHAAVYSATGASNSYEHMIVAQPRVHAQDPAAMVRISSSDSASAAALSEAARLWNSYHPLYAGKPTYVHGGSKDAYYRPNQIGEATCIDNPSNRTCILTVLQAPPRRMFDVFVHEIGHAVIPDNATGGGHTIDDTGHWSPSTHGEIFSQAIVPRPHMAIYTALAPSKAHSTACLTTRYCSAGDVCRPITGFQNVPRVCVGRQARGPYLALYTTTIVCVVILAILYIG